MELIDVTIRESVYLKNGITKKDALIYFEQYVKLMPFNEVKNVEICFLDTEGEGPLLYDAQYINDCYKILSKRFNLVAVLHPNLVDLSKWDANIISNFKIVRLIINSPINQHVIDIINYLHQINVEVSINVIYISRKTQSFVLDCIEVIKQNYVERMCIADSCGGCTPEIVSSWIRLIKEANPKLILNVHFHDHFKLALANTLVCMKKIDVIDASIHGIGKGGGNLSLEHILLVNRKINKLPLKCEEIIKYVELSKFLLRDVLHMDEQYEVEYFKNLLIAMCDCNLSDISNADMIANSDFSTWCQYIINNQ